MITFHEWATLNPTLTPDYRELLSERSLWREKQKEYQERLDVALNGDFIPRTDSLESAIRLDLKAFFISAIPKSGERIAASATLEGLYNQKEQLDEKIRKQQDYEAELTVEINNCRGSIERHQEKIERLDRQIRLFEFRLLDWHTNPQWDVMELSTALYQRISASFDCPDNVLDDLADFFTETDDDIVIDIQYRFFEFNVRITKDGYSVSHSDKDPEVAILRTWIDFVDTQWEYFLEIWKSNPHNFEDLTLPYEDVAQQS